MGISKNKTTLKTYFYQIDLLIDFFLLSMRSRRGFFIIFSLLRFGILIAGLVDIFYDGNINGNYSLKIVSLLVYICFSSAVYLYQSGKKFNKEIENLVVPISMFLDVAIISILIFLSNDPFTGLYLLYLLPMGYIAHYVPRWKALFFSCLILLIYLMIILFNGGINLENIFKWSGRFAFLMISVGLFRVQRTLPSISETSFIGPTKLREQLEDSLQELAQVIKFDSASIQIIYRNRLQIVACNGFENPKRIYRIDFPIDDENYPNHIVYRTRKWAIEDTESYKSFRNSIYQVAGVKSWLGIPLLSSATGELLGMLTLDSKEQNAFVTLNAVIATLFARKIATQLIEAPLGPAALTQAVKQETLSDSLRVWSEGLPQKAPRFIDDIQASQELVKICQEMFLVENCSIYFLRTKFDEEKNITEKVLHLKASTAIPKEKFDEQECVVNNQHGGDLTGYVVYADKCVNYNAHDVEISPYSGTNPFAKTYLPSGCVRQVMIATLKDNLGNPIGALRVDNKLGWPSESQFTFEEFYLFQAFSVQVGLIVERIRTRNFIERIICRVHDMKAEYLLGVLQPFEKINHIFEKSPNNSQNKNFDQGLNRIFDSFNDFLSDVGTDLILESQGVIIALVSFINLLKATYGNNENILKTISLIQIPFPEIRDDLPNHVRVRFYNVGREAVQNIIRHSGISEKSDGEAIISFTKGERVWKLTIKDNGVGFSKEKRLKEDGCFGIHYMEDQVDKLKIVGEKAKLMIDSKEGRGTTIIITSENSLEA